jgi:hypothetical protein
MKRSGIAMPAAIAAVVILAGIATLANLSATSAIRESRALRDAAMERAHRQTLRARALLQVPRRPRSQLIATVVSLGGSDTTLTTAPLSWPWHLLTVTTRGSRQFEELARAAVTAVPWCAGVVYATEVVIAGTVSVPPPSVCADRVHASADSVAAFDSALVAGTAGAGSSDTLVVDGESFDVVRARHVIVLTGTATVSGLIIAPVVRVLSGAVVRGLIVARDTAVVAVGAAVTADENAVAEALRNRARLVPLGRRGAILR